MIVPKNTYKKKIPTLIIRYTTDRSCKQFTVKEYCEKKVTKQAEPFNREIQKPILHNIYVALFNNPSFICMRTYLDT